jgi:hypothetical protein
MRWVAVLALVWSTGCQNFLTATDALHDPNNPSAATINQSFLASQASSCSSYR